MVEPTYTALIYLIDPNRRGTVPFNLLSKPSAIQPTRKTMGTRDLSEIIQFIVRVAYGNWSLYVLICKISQGHLFSLCKDYSNDDTYVH